MPLFGLSGVSGEVAHVIGMFPKMDLTGASPIHLAFYLTECSPRAVIKLDIQVLCFLFE